MAETIRKIDQLMFSENWNKNKDDFVPKERVIKAISNDPVFITDIAQSKNFTVHLAGFKDFQIPNSGYSKFLPVRNIDFTYTTYNNLSVPVGIFGDFPLLNRKSVSTIRLTCYDEGYGENLDIIERGMTAWEQECFPDSNHVQYLEKIIRVLTYTSYSVDGKNNYQQGIGVIPAGSTSISRSYEENGAKLFSFGLIAVGYVGTKGYLGDTGFGGTGSGDTAKEVYGSYSTSR